MSVRPGQLIPRSHRPSAPRGDDHGQSRYCGWQCGHSILNNPPPEPLVRTTPPAASHFCGCCGRTTGSSAQRAEIESTTSSYARRTSARAGERLAVANLGRLVQTRLRGGSEGEQRDDDALPATGHQGDHAGGGAYHAVHVATTSTGMPAPRRVGRSGPQFRSVWASSRLTVVTATTPEGSRMTANAGSPVARAAAALAPQMTRARCRCCRDRPLGVNVRAAGRGAGGAVASKTPSARICRRPHNGDYGIPVIEGGWLVGAALGAAPGRRTRSHRRGRGGGGLARRAAVWHRGSTGREPYPLRPRSPLIIVNLGAACGCCGVGVGATRPLLSLLRRPVLVILQAPRRWRSCS